MMRFCAHYELSTIPMDTMSVMTTPTVQPVIFSALRTFGGKFNVMRYVRLI